jgi:hypothetical protein
MAKGLKNTIKEYIRRPLIIVGLTTFLMSNWGQYIMNDIRTKAKTREQRIVQFYQKNGVCPSDATPAYLDLRTQLWQRDVEN